jgi:N-formylglutamate amidohydrolase
MREGTMYEGKDELDPPFEILEPGDCRGPAIFNSPHSGCCYPAEFLALTRLDERATGLHLAGDALAESLLHVRDLVARAHVDRVGGEAVGPGNSM